MQAWTLHLPSGLGHPLVLGWPWLMHCRMKGSRCRRACRPVLEGDGVKKVWHNFGFDRHVFANIGIK